MSHTQACIWCERVFTPRIGKNNYGLELAGSQICWACSDLWQDEMIKMHQEKIIGWMDYSRTKITTETGHILPLRVGEWTKSRYRNARAAVVDIYGKNWNAGLRHDLVTLKPAA